MEKINSNEINFIVKNDKYNCGDENLFFPGEEVVFVPENSDMYDLLVIIGVFKSKTEAGKNWKRSGREIKKGYSEWLFIGKYKKSIYILNPR